MEYSVISGTEMNVSRIAQGTWAIGGWMWGGTDERESIRTIHAAHDIKTDEKSYVGQMGGDKEWGFDWYY